MSLKCIDRNCNSKNCKDICTKCNISYGDSKCFLDYQKIKDEWFIFKCLNWIVSNMVKLSLMMNSKKGSLIPIIFVPATLINLDKY